MKEHVQVLQSCIPSIQISKPCYWDQKRNFRKCSNYNQKKKLKKISRLRYDLSLLFSSFFFSFFVYLQPELQNMFCSAAVCSIISIIKSRRISIIRNSQDTNQCCTILGPLYFAPSTTNSSGFLSLSSNQAYTSPSPVTEAGSSVIEQRSQCQQRCSLDTFAFFVEGKAKELTERTKEKEKCAHCA